MKKFIVTTAALSWLMLVNAVAAHPPTYFDLDGVKYHINHPDNGGLCHPTVPVAPGYQGGHCHVDWELQTQVQNGSIYMGGDPVLPSSYVKFAMSSSMYKLFLTDIKKGNVRKMMGKLFDELRLTPPGSTLPHYAPSGVPGIHKLETHSGNAVRVLYRETSSGREVVATYKKVSNPHSDMILRTFR